MVTLPDGEGERLSLAGCVSPDGSGVDVDPKEAWIGVLMPQRLWESASPPPTQLDLWTSTYQAIDD